MHIFSGAHEPVAGDDDEIAHGAVDLRGERGVAVTYFGDGADDGEVGGIGALGRVVFVSESFEVSCQ